MTKRTDRAALFPYLGGSGFTPLIALGALSGAGAGLMVVALQHRAELAIDLELSRTAVDQFLAAMSGLAAFGALAAALPRTVRGVRITVQVAGLALAVSFAALAVVNEAGPLRLLLGVAAVSAGSVWALTRTVALDICGPTGGWRVVAMPWVGAALGVGAFAAVDVATDSANWGYELAAAAVIALLAAAVIPSSGVRAASSPDTPVPSAKGPGRGPLLLTSFLLGAATLGVTTTGWDLLVTKWGFDRSEAAGVVLLCAAVAAAVGGLGHWFGRQATRSPSHLAASAQVLAAVSVGLVALGAASVTEIGVLFCWAGAAGAAILFAISAETALLSGRSSTERAVSSAALVATVALGGGLATVMITLVSGVSRGWLIAAAAAPAFVVAAMSVVAAPRSRPAIVGSAADHPDHRTTASPTQPLLVCRGIEVAYGNVQVLFGVDLCVEEGQIVALLGTNGAGKTTLLRTIAGLESQRAGSIHFAGADISRFDPTWRVGLGINQIAGGQALAEDLTVADNLRLFGYSLGRHRVALHAGMDRAFDLFPRLAERRNQPASTLSGGEKQMLALSKALILRPRLLIIDEFSLGLAPKIVGELLPVVTDLNRAGTAVLLVEQSVNIALSVASFAYCMEKGEIVFEGSAARLRDDPDLMRSVYLEGVSKALAS